MNPKNNTEYSVTAVGVIIPVEWDQKGNPQAYAISTYDEQEYLIDNTNDAGRKLTRMTHQKIRVSGNLGDMINNRRIMTVTGFERI